MTEHLHPAFRAWYRQAWKPSDLVLSFVNVEDVDDRPEVAHDVVVPAHVGRRDAADHVLAQVPELFDGQVVERVRRRVVQQAKRVRAVVALQRRYVVVAMCQRRTGTNLHRKLNRIIQQTTVLSTCLARPSGWL